MNTLLKQLQTLHSEGAKRKHEEDSSETSVSEESTDPRTWLQYGRPENWLYYPPQEQLRYKTKIELREWLFKREARVYKKGTRLYHGGSTQKLRSGECCFYLATDLESARAYAKYDPAILGLESDAEKRRTDPEANFITTYELKHDITLYQTKWWSAIGLQWGIDPSEEETSWSSVDDLIRIGYYDGVIRAAEYEFNQAVSELDSVMGLWNMNEVMLTPPYYGVLKKVDQTVYTPSTDSEEE